VVDDGRGIPVKEMPQYGKPAVEIVMTKLHAGGKFGGGGYKVSGGLHGVGVSVVNALSEWLTVEVSRDGHRFQQSYAAGVPTTELVKMGRSAESGTTVHFRPDSRIFDDLNFNFTVISQRLREMAFLNRSLRITLVDEREDAGENETARPTPTMSTIRVSFWTARPSGRSVSSPTRHLGAERRRGVTDGGKRRSGPRKVVYCYSGGIVDFVKHINKQKEPIHPA